MDKKKIAKYAGRRALDAAILTTTAAKYGVHISAEASKIVLGGALNMANSFASSPFKTNSGDKAVGAIDKYSGKSFDWLIKQQKKLKEKLK